MGSESEHDERKEKDVVRRLGFFPASEAPNIEDVNEIEKGIGKSGE